MDALGESSDSEGDSSNLQRLRNRLDVLNSNLHEIFEGEDQGEGEVKGIDIADQTQDLKLKLKKNHKPEHLDHIASTYSFKQQTVQDVEVLDQ